MNPKDYQEGMEAERNRNREIRERRKDNRFFVGLFILIPVIIWIIKLIVR